MNRGVTGPLIDLLRADLAAANFSVTALTGLWGIEADAALHRNQRVPALRALARLRATLTVPEPNVVFAQLFVLGLPVDRAELAAALPSLGLDGAETLGLITAHHAHAGTAESPTVDTGAAQVAPLVALRPHSFVDAHGAGSWWITSDLGELALGHPLGEGHVLGVGGASLTLSALMIPTPVERALDLGTGCGIQALHASRHAARVVATDISERALELAALNARLNGVENIEFRLGSLFEPVAGERFDHIISNPPFVITPRVEGVPSYEYRDGGLVGDALVEAVVRGAAEHLTAGGVAQLLGNWEYHDDDAFDRLTGWLERPTGGEAPLDVWIIEREVQAPTGYAETWIRDGGTRPDTPDFDRLYGAWLDDFEARGVLQVGFGYMLLRRPTDGRRRAAAPARPRLLRLERLPEALGHNPAGIGHHLAECLAAHDWQAGLDDDALSRSTLTVASDVTEERHFWPGQEDPTLLTLHQGGGFGRSVSLDTAQAALIGACDGELAVGAIIDAIAQLLDADAAALRAELLPRVRALLDDGFLEPPAAGSGA
ncbi:methyltransferase domain-containing protein [Cryobacterium lactosi]|uniref:Methyltransferase domain-containing protein n=1 Tax=Cryobacterium lactosi TaxID=1259202 RepID=A0A4V3IY34_9MICO|nr:methyltransferase domain-containing protein [Cryobacterium lactosi]